MNVIVVIIVVVAIKSLMYYADCLDCWFNFQPKMMNIFTENRNQIYSLPC